MSSDGGGDINDFGRQFSQTLTQAGKGIASSPTFNPIGKGNGNFEQMFYDGIAPGFLEKKNGGWYGGFGNHITDEGLGELTGRNATRNNQHKEQESLDNAEANRQLDAADALQKKQYEQIQASNMATLLANQGNRTSNLGTSGTLPSTPTLDPSSDFLGL